MIIIIGIIGLIMFFGTMWIADKLEDYIFDELGYDIPFFFIAIAMYVIEIAIVLQILYSSCR